MRDTYFAKYLLKGRTKAWSIFAIFSHLGVSHYKISIINKMRNLIHPTLLSSSGHPQVPVLRQGGVALGTEEEAMA